MLWSGLFLQFHIYTVIAVAIVQPLLFSVAVENSTFSVGLLIRSINALNCLMVKEAGQSGSIVRLRPFCTSTGHQDSRRDR